MNICVFCSSSPNLDTAYVQAARELGRLLAERGHALVFGGYDLGLMGDVAHACAEAGGRVIGVVTEGLSRSAHRATFPCDELHMTADLAARKARMSELTDAFVTLPGGLGTFDELFGVLAQAKVGEITARSALINTAGYFDALVAMLDHASATGLNSTDWRTYAEVFAAPEQALDYLERP